LRRSWQLITLEKVRNLIFRMHKLRGERGVRMSQERMEKFTTNKGLSPEEILRKDMDIYFSDKFIQDNPEKIREFIEISLRYYQPAHAFERQFAACLKHDTADRLRNISVPTWIVAGDDDPLVPSENSQILKELMPWARLQFLPACGHAFFIEAADLFNREVIAFLSG